MKCPTCGAWSLVLDTRTKKEGMRRRRKCANGHRFVTVEAVVPTNMRDDDRRSAAFKERQKAPV